MLVAGNTSVSSSVCIANTLSGERQCAGHLGREGEGGGGRGREGEGGGGRGREGKGGRGRGREGEGGGGWGGDRLNEERREIFHNEMFFLSTTPSFSFFPPPSPPPPLPLPSPSPPPPLPPPMSHRVIPSHYRRHCVYWKCFFSCSLPVNGGEWGASC